MYQLISYLLSMHIYICKIVYICAFYIHKNDLRYLRGLAPTAKELTYIIVRLVECGFRK